MNVGIVTLQYTEAGILDSYDFKSDIQLPKEFEIDKLLVGDKIEKIKATADLVMATWFNRVAEIELADRTEYTLVGETVMCDKYASGAVKACQIRYFLRPVGRGSG